jgi:hypothetical protein
LASSARREKRGRQPGAARFAAAPGRRGGGVRKKKGRGGERLAGGAHMSARRNKKKKKEAARAGAGRRLMGRWAAGLKGGKVSFFFSFSFFFQTPFKTIFSFQIQTKFFQTFDKKFINFLEDTQATKNHAKPTDDAQSLVVSILIKLCLIF